MKKGFLLTLLCLLSCQPKQDWSYPGLFFGFDVDGFPVTEQVLQGIPSGIKPEMIVFYLQWPTPSITSSIDTIWKSGAVPCLTWEPMITADQTEKMIPYEDILSGRYDPYIASVAAEVKLWKNPLIIRFAQEMNISRYHWGTRQEDFGARSAEIYKKMFQYVVNLFRKHEVNNVLWAFCPNADSVPDEPWNAAKNYYPGDAYVDILGMDGYNWNINEAIAAARKQTWIQPWHTFEQIFQALYKELKSINPHKPIIVFETASVNRAGDPKKSLWIQDALKVAKAWDIKGIVWFQVKKEEDWRINQNDDDSYIPLLQSSKPSFQTWLKEQYRPRK